MFLFQWGLKLIQAMKYIFLYKSMFNGYNFSQAHFIRGVAEQLIGLGHDVDVFVPESPTEFMASEELASDDRNAFSLQIRTYNLLHLKDSGLLDDADLVIVHHENKSELFDEVFALRKNRRFKVFIHDSSSNHFDLKDSKNRNYAELADGVLVGAGYLISQYLAHTEQKHVFLWPNAVDSKVFFPSHETVPDMDFITLSNWNNGKKGEELMNYFINPAKKLNRLSTVVGVDYPAELVKRNTHVDFKGFVPNIFVPKFMYRHKVFVHLPSKSPYDISHKPSPGIFEAMACGIPVISAPWDDSDCLFEEGIDYVLAKDEREMEKKLKELVLDRQKALEIARNAMRAINRKHTCRHRVKDLLEFCKQRGVSVKGNNQEAA
jgi:glycosyltransferase involved in cell wall biosynthesis